MTPARPSILMRRRLLPILLLAAGLAAACSDTKESAGDATAELAPLGSLPDGDGGGQRLPNGVTRTTVPLAPEERLGRLVEGNRVIMLGDSVLASTTERYGGEMCEQLVPLGWQVEIDAESGRAIQWGNYVLDSRLDGENWDIGVVFLGSNYGGNQQYYHDQLAEIVERLSPIPVVVVTVTQFEASRLEVNEAIFEVAVEFPNVFVLDWAVVTANDPTLTGRDGLHLTEDGRLRLADEMAMVLGEAPLQPGDCLPTDYTDDSMGPVTGSNGPIESSTTTTTTTPKGNGSNGQHGGNGAGPPPSSTTTT